MTKRFALAVAAVAALLVAWGMTPAMADPLTDEIGKVEGLLTRAEAEAQSEEAKAYLEEARTILAEAAFVARIAQIEELLAKVAWTEWDAKPYVEEAMALLAELKKLHEEAEVKGAVDAAPVGEPAGVEGLKEEEKFLTYP